MLCHLICVRGRARGSDGRSRKAIDSRKRRHGERADISVELHVGASIRKYGSKARRVQKKEEEEVASCR